MLPNAYDYPNIAYNIQRFKSEIVYKDKWLTGFKILPFHCNIFIAIFLFCQWLKELTLRRIDHIFLK